MALRASPVQQEAEQAGLAVRTPERLKSAEEQERFRALQADVAVVVAYGLILPKPILDATRLGLFNVHASLLPRWRGAAPINRAIMAGDRETGVSIMRIVEGLDAGPVCLEGRVAIGRDETAGELHDRLAREGARLMVSALTKLEAGSLDCRAQVEDGVTYAAEDRRWRDAHRLEAIRAQGARYDPRALAVSGRLVRDRAQRAQGTRAGAPLDAGGNVRHARHRA